MNFTQEELEARGWQIWNANEKGILMICPLVDFPNVPDGTEMWSIWDKFGGKLGWELKSEKKIKGVDEINMDTRAGMLAWGVYVEQQNAFCIVSTIRFSIKALQNGG